VELGLPFPSAVEASEPEEFRHAGFTFPVVVKGNVNSATHKSAAGLVRVGVRSWEELQSVGADVRRLATAFGADTILVEEQAWGDVQAILAIVDDPQAGRLLLIGSGGSAIEDLNDTAVSLLDLGPREEVKTVLARTHLGRFLVRRSPRLADDLIRLSSTLVAFSEKTRGATIEINPILIDTASQRLTCVDARLTTTGR
jgi:acetyltransferase